MLWDTFFVYDKPSAVKLGGDPTITVVIVFTNRCSCWSASASSVYFAELVSERLAI